MEQKNATDSNALTERISQNESNQNLDLNKWAFAHIGPKENLRILELCCGIGRQTEQLLKKFEGAVLTCVDISAESLQVIEKSAFYDAKRVTLVNDNLDAFFEKNTETFDLVFVSYGLYYAKNISYVIQKLHAAIAREGSFIVLGPYKDNNKQLFDLVNSVGVEIDKFVRYSSTDFMYVDALGKSLGIFEGYQIDTAVNTIQWNSVKEVVQYWENTTFYDAAKRDAFVAATEKHFSSAAKFINEKHIMLLQCLKRK